MASRTLTIPGRFEGMNEYIAAMNSNRQLGNRMKRSRTEEGAWHCRAQLRGWKPKPPVRLTYLFVEPNRKRDKDNIAGFAHKVVQDGMVLARVLKNDGWDDVDGFADDFAVDKKRPRIEIIITEAEP